MALLQLLVLFVALSSQQVQEGHPDENRVSLHLLNILPFPDSRPNTGWDRAYELIPAAQLAVDQINSAPHILPGYKLELVNVDAEACGVSIVTKGLVNTFAHLFTPNISLNVVAFTGLFCSTVTNIISPIFGAPGMTYLQLAGSTSPAHRDSNKFPWLVHFISSADTINDAMLEMIREFSWETVNVVFESMNVFTEANAESLKQRARDTLEFKVTANIPITGKRDSVAVLTKVNSRIVYISALNTDTARLLCEAYKREALFPAYVYFLPEKSLSGLLSKVKTTDCTLDQLTKALEGVFFLRYRLANSQASKLVSNLTYQEYQQQYRQRLMEKESATNTTLNKNNIYANAMHDEIWAFALALGKAFGALQAAKIIPENLQLQQTRQFASILRSQFDNVSFEGVSGFVKFNLDKEESSVVEISQVINSTSELVGVYYPDASEKLQLLRDLSLPPDSFEITTVLLPVWVSAFFNIYFLVCIFVTTSVVIFLYLFKHRPEVKASSPSLSLAMIAGCYLLFVSTLTRNVSRGYSVTNVLVFTLLCNVQMWFAMMGLTLIFSALLLRLLRISRIFKAYGKVSPYWKNRYMILCILAICFGVIVILIWWTVADKINVVTTTTYQPRALPPFFEMRSVCNTVGIGLVLALAYNGILMLINVFLAVQTRKIRLSNFKNTKQINAFIALTCMTLGILVPLWYVIDRVYMYNILGHFIVCFALSCTGVYCQLFVFLPRVFATAVNMKTEKNRGGAKMSRKESQFSQQFTGSVHGST